MASATATPPALRWVVLFLVLCAALGLWMGFKDQIRRNPPDWYTGTQARDVAAPGVPSNVRDAIAFDPGASPTPSKPVAAAPAPKAEEEPAEAAATTTEAAAAAPSPVATPAAPKPKAAPPAARAGSDDPVGDILDGQRPAPESRPDVPY